MVGLASTVVTQCFVHQLMFMDIQCNQSDGLIINRLCGIDGPLSVKCYEERVS